MKVTDQIKRTSGEYIISRAVNGYVLEVSGPSTEQEGNYWVNVRIICKDHAELLRAIVELDTLPAT